METLQSGVTGWPQGFLLLCWLDQGGIWFFSCQTETVSSLLTCCDWTINCHMVASDPKWKISELLELISCIRLSLSQGDPKVRSIKQNMEAEWTAILLVSSWFFFFFLLPVEWTSNRLRIRICRDGQHQDELQRSVTTLAKYGPVHQVKSLKKNVCKTEATVDSF